MYRPNVFLPFQLSPQPQYMQALFLQRAFTRSQEQPWDTHTKECPLLPSHTERNYSGNSEVLHSTRIFIQLERSKKTLNGDMEQSALPCKHAVSLTSAPQAVMLNHGTFWKSFTSILFNFFNAFISNPSKILQKSVFLSPYFSKINGCPQKSGEPEDTAL